MTDDLELFDEATEVVRLLNAYGAAYPESVFPTPPEHLRAKDAAAADVMRQLALPMMARAAEVIDRLLDPMRDKGRDGGPSNG